MRIAFFGSSLVSAYWNGAATYFRGLLRALARRGHDITFYEPDAYDRQRHRDIPDPDWARVVVYPPEEGAVAAALRHAAGRSDVLVKASGVGVLDGFLEREVLRYRRRGALAIFWDVDAPATLDRLAADPDDPFHALVPAYDLVMTYGGGPPVIDGYIRRGAVRCVPIYNALDKATHFPVEPEPRYACDLLFVGNRLPDREARVREFFLRPAELLPDARFLLGGNGWEAGAPTNVSLIGHVFTAQHNALNCSARAVLNVNRASMASYGFSPPTRIFEAAGAAACIISDAWTGLELFLEPGEEVLVAQDGEDVAALLAQLTPALARTIGAAARRRILSEHTYDRRALEVESVLGEHWSYA